MQQLVASLGSARRVWEATQADLQAHGLPEANVQAFVEKRREISVEKEREKLDKLRCRLVLRDDGDYPPMLLNTADAPPLLYVRGRYLPTDSRALAVVGTRKATRYGRDATTYLTRELAKAGITIVSGTAEGIDTCAHEGVLEADGRSIAVLGHGVDVIYPQSNRDLLRRLVETGAIISEFPPQTPPHRSNFPRRNRIISGMTLGVLITEAPEKSGALITATIALEQGRDVFVVPANIFNSQGRGSNRLIQDGAKLIMSADDILVELDSTHERTQVRAKMAEITPESDSERRILEHLGVDPIHIDDLIRLSGMPAHEVSATLTVLELKGVAQMNGSMQYSRVVV